MKKSQTSRAARVRRHVRVRKSLAGTPERPRLAIFRSLNHIYAQVIDDVRGQTLVTASTLEEQLRGRTDGRTKAEAAKLVGQLLAQRAREQGVSQVVFDRGGYRYHGRVKALAEAAREAGLEF